MFKFLFFIVGFIVLMTLLLGFSFLRTLKRILFGGGSSQKRTSQRQTGRSSSRQQPTQPTAPPKQKIFTKDEGEYVDYEEIKE